MFAGTFLRNIVPCILWWFKRKSCKTNPIAWKCRGVKKNVVSYEMIQIILDAWGKTQTLATEGVATQESRVKLRVQT